MRNFAPSLIAFVAGAAWLAISTALVPAGKGGRPLAVAEETSLSGACQTATMVARLPDVHEASGVTLSGKVDDLLWTHNDSGDPEVFAIGADGQLRGRVRVTGASVEDWEGIAAGPCPEGSCLYIADIGDNKEERSHVTIYRVPEPAPTARATAPATPINLAYPDRPQDAEGLFIGPDRAPYLVTKGEGSPIKIYRAADAPAGTVARLQHVVTLSGEARKDQRITDANGTPDGKWVALRTLESIEFHPAVALLSGDAQQGIEARVKRIGEPQGEGIALRADGTVFLAGEAGDGVRGGTLARVSCTLPAVTRRAP